MSVTVLSVSVTDIETLLTREKKGGCLIAVSIFPPLTTRGLSLIFDPFFLYSATLKYLII
jgi:hypothetical protein